MKIPEIQVEGENSWSTPMQRQPSQGLLRGHVDHQQPPIRAYYITITIDIIISFIGICWDLLGGQKLGGLVTHVESHDVMQIGMANSAPCKEESIGTWFFPSDFRQESMVQINCYTNSDLRGHRESRSILWKNRYSGGLLLASVGIARPHDPTCIMITQMLCKRSTRHGFQMGEGRVLCGECVEVLVCVCVCQRCVLIINVDEGKCENLRTYCTRTLHALA